MEDPPTTKARSQGTAMQGFSFLACSLVGRFPSHRAGRNTLQIAPQCLIRVHPFNLEFNDLLSLGSMQGALCRPKTHFQEDIRRPEFRLLRMTDPTVYLGTRPRLSRHFYKAHGLGNDYLVFEVVEGDQASWIATPENVAMVCGPHRGLASDGLVVVMLDQSLRSPAHAVVSLRMFNPDGSEFERSGNGLRVLAASLSGLEPRLSIIDAKVGGGEVRIHVHGMTDGTFDISVEMGVARLGPEAIGAGSGLLHGESEPYTLMGPEGEKLEVVPVSIGNPHVVILTDPQEESFSEERLSVLGPFIASHPDIPAGTNVQLARSQHGRGQACIWERGVGRTAASGTSSCAVAVALVVTGALPFGAVLIDMPGGQLSVSVHNSLEITLRGPVTSVMSGTIEDGLLAKFEPVS